MLIFPDNNSIFNSHSINTMDEVNLDAYLIKSGIDVLLYRKQYGSSAMGMTPELQGPANQHQTELSASL